MVRQVPPSLIQSRRAEQEENLLQVADQDLQVLLETKGGLTLTTWTASLVETTLERGKLRIGRTVHVDVSQHVAPTVPQMARILE